MSSPSPDIQRNLVNIVLTIVGLIQGLVFTKIAENIAQLVTAPLVQNPINEILILIFLFVVFLRVFQTFVVGAIGYEKAAIDALELFVLLLLLFVVGAFEYVLIELYKVGKWQSIYWHLSILCGIATLAYGWLCYRARAFSQDNPPFATRDRRLQAANTAVAAMTSVGCTWLAVHQPDWLTQIIILSLSVLVLINVYISIRMSFYPPHETWLHIALSWCAHAPQYISECLTTSKSRRYLAELILLYVLTPALVFFHIVGFPWRMHVLVIVGIIIIIISMIDRSIGFSPRSRSEYLFSLCANAALIAIVMLLAFGYRAWSPSSNKLQSIDLTFLAFYFIVSVPVQEFVYRVRLHFIFGRAPMIYIIMSATLFAWAHVIYFDPLIVAGAFSLGLAWAAIFWRTRDYIGIVLSHCAIGLGVFLTGLA